MSEKNYAVHIRIFTVFLRISTVSLLNLHLISNLSNHKLNIKPKKNNFFKKKLMKLSQFKSVFLIMDTILYFYV